MGVEPRAALAGQRARPSISSWLQRWGAEGPTIGVSREWAPCQRSKNPVMDSTSPCGSNGSPSGSGFGWDAPANDIVSKMSRSPIMGASPARIPASA